jgi:hypothetical protein
MFLIAFPLLLVPFALYNMIAYLLNMDFNTTVFSVPVLSGRPMAVSMGDMLVVVGVLLLYLEIFKAARMSSKQVMDQVLSLLLFVAMAVEFVIAERAATSTFLILLALSFVDVIGGFTIRSAKRDVTFETPDRMSGP